MTGTQQAGRQVEETFRRFGSLINFAMILGGLIIAVMAGGSWKTTIETEIGAGRSWQANHEAYHRDALADRKEAQGRTDALLSKLTDTQFASDRKADSLEQRVTTLEKAVNTVEQNAASTNKSLGEISGNMQVMKEILSRIEKKQGG